jgi:hypothetical protein
MIGYREWYISSNIPKMIAIKLIGDSFHFHVAHLFKRELENASIR